MSTSSGSRVLRDGTIATSSKPYARRADLPMPISNSTPITPEGSPKSARRPSGTPDGRLIAAWGERTSRSRRARSAAGDRFESPASLRQMEPIVARDHAEAEFEALGPALGMHADAGTILLGGVRPQRDVR